jgi:hypothetical protein
MLTAEWKLEDAIKIRCEETEARTTRKFVKKMYQGGFTVKQIVKLFGLPEKDVKEILEVK